MTTKTKTAKRVSAYMPYPNRYQVEIASQLQLGRWQFRLPLPVTDDERELWELINTRFRGWTPWLQKAVNWTNRFPGQTS